jgi:hypothetical protein
MAPIGTKGRNLLAPAPAPADDPYFSLTVPNPFGETPLLDIQARTPTLENAGKVLQSVDDRVRSAANAMTFNLADRGAAEMADLTGVGGPTTAEGQFAATDAAREREPQHLATDAAAMLYTAPTKGLGYLGSKLGTIPSLLGYGAEGALSAGGSEYVRSQDLQKAKEAAETGALWGAGGAAAGNLAGNVGKRLFPKGFQSGDEVLQAAKERFERAKAANASYPAKALDDMLAGMDKTLAKHDVDPFTAPKMSKEVEKAKTQYSGADVEATRLDKVGRKIVKKGAKDTDNRAVAHDLRRDVDTTLRGGPDPKLKIHPYDPSGTPRPDVAEDIVEGRKLHGQGKRAEQLEKAERNAQFAAKQDRDWEHSLENQRRQKLKPVLDKVDESVTGAGWSQAQRDKLAELVNGTWGRNAIRAAARMTSAPFPLNLVTSSVSRPLRGILNLNTSAKIRELNEMIRNGTDATDRALAERLRSAGGRIGTVRGSQ